MASPSSFTPDLAKPIGKTITEWVHEECLASVSGRNAYFDDLSDSRVRLGLEMDDPGNHQAAKYFSHFGRQRVWGEAMVAEPAHDFATARHIFNLLMQMSGVSRRMCYFRATDQQDYIRLKTAPEVVGVDATQSVAGYIHEVTGADSSVMPSPQDVQRETLAGFEAVNGSLEILRTRIPQDFGIETSPALMRLQQDQEVWARLVTMSIFMAMSYREDDLAAVPVLEPKSISDEPAIMYPFKT